MTKENPDTEVAGIRTVKMIPEIIKCPECQTIQVGQILPWEPFDVYLHDCVKCDHLIMESEWDVANTLHLNLKRKWYDMIQSGDKLEEYREIKAYWAARIILVDGKKMSVKWWKEWLEGVSQGFAIVEMLEDYLRSEKMRFIDFDITTFQNGMSKTADRCTVKHLGIKIKEGKPEWGAEEGVKYFCIQLGSII